MNYEFSEALSEQVQAARKEHGFTQDEVGELIGKPEKQFPISSEESPTRNLTRFIAVPFVGNGCKSGDLSEQR